MLIKLDFESYLNVKKHWSTGIKYWY